MSSTWKVIHGDALAVLPTIERGSVQTVITSPPYWGLRDYGLDPIEWPSGWVGGLGLEPTLDQFLENMVAIFRELREVLRDDGTAWVNMGDSYSTGTELQAKQRLMVPARLALALQADGWWIRSEIVWSKPNPMPSSVRDRPTDAHEMIYLLSKRPRYFYDADAIREAAITAGEKGLGFYSIGQRRWG
jgi:site-specific DNA-methyltransferase (adenine-specific)